MPLATHSLRGGVAAPRAGRPGRRGPPQLPTAGRPPASRLATMPPEGRSFAGVVPGRLFQARPAGAASSAVRQAPTERAAAAEAGRGRDRRCDGCAWGASTDLPAGSGRGASCGAELGGGVSGGDLQALKKANSGLEADKGQLAKVTGDARCCSRRAASSIAKRTCRIRHRF